MSDDILSGDDVAVTGSPNTVKSVRFDVRQGHMDTPLLGSLVAFRMDVGSASGRGKLLVLGQVSDATTSNRWHEDDGFKDYLKKKGSLPHLTGAADVTTGNMQVLGTYELSPDGTGWTKSATSVPCGSGRSVRRVDAGVVKALMASETGYSYVGDFYGTRDVPAPVFTRHFGHSDEGGAGEAFIGGVFGPSGSGKTVFGLSLATLWARHDRMGFLFLDPQGEMEGDQVSGGTTFRYAFHDQLREATAGRFQGRPGVDLFTVANVQLEGVDLFLRILAEKGFFDRAGVGAGKESLVVDVLAGELRELPPETWRASMSWEQARDAEIPVVEYDDRGEKTSEGKRPFTEWLALAMADCYAGGSRAGKLKEFRTKLRTPLVRTYWDDTARLFRTGEGRQTLTRLVEGVLKERRVVILSLDPQGVDLPESLRNDIVLLVFRKVSEVANANYRSKAPANAMVVLDEAAQFIPRHTDDERIRRIAQDLSAKSKMLRKLGVGMLFMTQRISGIKEDIFAQMHFRIYGQGLNVAGDATAIRDREGKEAFDLYDSLPDPRLTKRFSFMVAGSLVAMGSSGQPMFVTGYGDGEAMMAANRFSFRPVSRASLSEATAGATAASGPRAAPTALGRAAAGLRDLA